jgi:antitoxin component HigA of HigAB toxin-antitoxin module
LYWTSVYLCISLPDFLIFSGVDRMGTPLRNEADYDAALAEAANLMGASPGTTGGSRLDALVALIEGYEARRWAVR